VPHNGQLTITIETNVTVKVWLEDAVRDADRRGLPALRPLLETLARATSALRSADWNFDATGGRDRPEGADAR
jgi:hypothetical protein